MADPTDLKGREAADPTDLKGREAAYPTDLKGCEEADPTDLKGREAADSTDLKGREAADPTDLKGRAAADPTYLKGRDRQVAHLPGALMIHLAALKIVIIVFYMKPDCIHAAVQIYIIAYMIGAAKKCALKTHCKAEGCTVLKWTGLTFWIAAHY